MKATKFIYALSLAAVLGLSSCGSDFLNTPTDSRVELDSTEKLRMLLTSSYPSYNYAWPCEIMSDNMEDNQSPDENGLRYNLAPYNKGDEEMFRWEVCVTNTSSDSPSGIWEQHYGAIAGANAVLEVIEKWENEGVKLDMDQKAIKGEALLIRSYCHFILAQCFCMPYGGESNKGDQGIPYVTKPEKTVKPHYERGTLGETYDKIRKDLEDGLALVSDHIYEIPKYHFNTAAAHAYAARFYLFTREYDKCLEHCNACLGGEGGDASTYLNPIWSNLESMYYISDFGRFSQGANKAHNFLLIATYSQAMRHYLGGLRFGVIRDALNSTIHGDSPAWSSFKWRSSKGDGDSFTMHPCFNGSCAANGKSEYGMVFCGNVAEQFEYTDKLAGIGYTHITKSEFTGDEMLLTRAEALLFLGQTDKAIEDLDKWEKNRRNCPAASGMEDNFKDLTRQSITNFYSSPKLGFGIAKKIHIDEICPSQWSLAEGEMTAILQCIQHFRRIETLHTGMRWFDIKRYGLEFDRKIGRYEVDHLGVKDLRKAMQIPAEIQAAGMEPNKRIDDQRVQSSDALEFVGE